MDVLAAYRKWAAISVPRRPAARRTRRSGGWSRRTRPASVGEERGDRKGRVATTTT
jgi:hypothetical protein